jgi:DNA polymerase delta subunit 2
MYAKVVRVVIAGNLLSPSTRNKEHESKAKYLTRNIKAESVEAMKDLDESLAQLAVSICPVGSVSQTTRIARLDCC